MSENIYAIQQSLDGEWETTYNGRTQYLQVPGAWDMQGIGDVAGPVFYRRQLDIPAEWRGRRVLLNFAALSYHVEVWLNGQHQGTHEGMWTPFSIDLTDDLRFGAPNSLELRVTKSGRTSPHHYRETLVGFIPYIATTFGGPWQNITLSAHDAPAWESVQLKPDWQTGVLTVHAITSVTDSDLSVTAVIVDATGAHVSTAEQHLMAGETAVHLSLTAPEHHAWSPPNPYLYKLRLTLEQNGQSISGLTRRFGFRQLSAQGDALLLNEMPIHLRGILSWGWNPATLAPVFTDDEIRAEFRRIREHGFNLLKLCLFVPPPRFYEIADEEGMLLWLELPMWLPRLSDHLRAQAQAEYKDILARDHHHPSVVLYSLGCELNADMADAALLRDLDHLVRNAVTGALVCDNSGSGEAYAGLSFDFADFNDYHFYCDLHHFVPLLNHFRRDWRPARPWIFGEFCDKDDFRIPDDPRPWWREVYGIEGNPERWAYPEQEQRMAAHDLPFTSEQIREISRRESLLFRKFILEQTRLRPAIRGYVVTGLRDTPISTSGVFDDDNQPKYDPAQFRMFNDDAVLLLETGRKRIWQHGGDQPDPVDCFNHLCGASADLRVVLAHTGGLAPDKTELRWGIFAPGSLTPAYAGEMWVNLPTSSTAEIARIGFTVPALAQAEEWRLHVTLDGICENQWSLWFYPVDPAPLDMDISLYDPTGALRGSSAIFTPPDGKVLLTSVLTPAVQEWVTGGGRAILLAAAGGGGLPLVGVPFWRESIKLLYAHPMLADFPHRGHADLQFYHLAASHALDTARLPASIPALSGMAPIIRRLDARLFTLTDYLIELHIGKGKLLATTLCFTGGQGDQVRRLEHHPAAQHLLSLMIRYLHE